MEQLKINPGKWSEWLQVKGLSETSIKNYYFYYQKFKFDKIDQDYVISFLHKYNNPVARAFVKSIIEYLELKDINIPKVTGRKKYREPEVLSLEEVNMVSNVMRSERNKIMVLVNFYCGLRVSELVNLKPYDINFTEWIKNPKDIGYVKVKQGKGNKDRTVFLTAEIMERIYRWANEYNIGNKQGKEDPLFKIKQRRYEILLSKAGLKALERKVYPHLLRHSCASYLLKEGWNLKEIADYLGHKSISTTGIYLHLNKNTLANRFKRTHK